MVRLKVKSEEEAKNYVQFQFLMVRLKECMECRKQLANSISIPYGSIKRLLDNAPNIEYSDFNSLWFD